MVAYLRFEAAELPRSVGVDAPGGRRRSDGRAGHICHGPYLTLPPGRYAAGFYLRREPGDEDGEVEIEASADHGRRSLGLRRLAVKSLFSTGPGLRPVEFSLNTPERGCELRVWASARAKIELSEVVLIRTDLAGRARA